MRREFKIKGILFCVVVITATTFLWGCAIMPYKHTSGEPIKEDKTKMIQPGKTTKEEIIQWFGIPSVIAKKGEKMSLPIEMAGGMYGIGAAGEVGKQEVSSDTFFNLFSSKHKLIENHRIYYFTYTKNKGSTFNMPFFGYSGGRALTDKLLVLINEDTGIVEDYIFRKQE